MFRTAKDKSFWYVVADESIAVIYESRTRRSALRERCVLENPVTREKTDELIADRGGRSYDSHGRGRHTLQNEKTGPKKQASIAFAKEVVDRIARAKEQGKCRDFALVAAPRFLGLLRHELRTAAVNEPFLSIDKNLVSKSALELREIVDQQLA